MKPRGAMIAAAAGMGIAALAHAQTSPAPGQPAPWQQATPAERPDSSSAAGTPATAADRDTRIAELAPSGTSAQGACGGFKSISECAATLHAAQNCGIAFKDLKAKVTGGEKLGAAIHDLKPDADVASEVARAEAQARADLRSPGG